MLFIAIFGVSAIAMLITVGIIIEGVCRSISEGVKGK